MDRENRHNSVFFQDEPLLFQHTSVPCQISNKIDARLLLLDGARHYPHLPSESILDSI
jgi:hypothetical protein